MSVDKENGPASFGWSERRSSILLFLMAVSAVLINIPRLFDNNFWSDECFSINLLKNDLQDIWWAAAGDTHPPLFYYIGFVVTRVFGFNKVSFHLISLFALFVILVVSLTWIRDRFGNVPAALMIVSSSVLSTSLQYAVEVRMYEWCAVFVLLTFLSLYELVRVPDRQNTALVVAFGVAAAYTHVYGLIAVAAMYVCMFIASIVWKGIGIRRVILMATVSLILYLPWLGAIFSALGRTSDFWITGNPTVPEILEYLFQTEVFAVSVALSVFTILLCVLMLLHGAGKLGKVGSVMGDASEGDRTKTVWVALCLSSAVLTMVLAAAISDIIRPYFVLRYVYPICILAWLMLGVGIAAARHGTVVAAVVIVAILAVAAPYYVDLRNDELADDARIANTLDVTSEIGCDDTTYSPMVWVMDYYYPDASNLEFNRDAVEGMDTVSGRTNWLFLFEPISEETSSQIAEKGCTAEFHYHGSLGSHDAWIYRIVTG